MKILFNGDSNVAGEELRDRSKSMAGVIADYYHADSVNLALSGASNERIYNTTLEYLANNPAPDLVVIGWSEHGREQWYYNGQFHEVNNLGVGASLPDQLKRRFQFWKQYIQQDAAWFRVMNIYWHNKIYNLHTILAEKNISHLFFNAFHAFHHPENQQLDWQGQFFCPYYQNRCYVNWCVEHGFEEITPGWQHFNEDAHSKWGELLISEIEKFKV